MSECAEIFANWPAAEAGAQEPAEISLVWPEPIDEASACAALQPAVGDRPFELMAAFPLQVQAEGASRYWILRLPTLAAEGAERQAFEAARCLRRALQLASARPVLVDSLVGAAMAEPPRGAAAEAILGGLCNTKDPGPAARGWAPLALGVRQAWSHTQGDGVTIASIDTGVSDHPQLAGVLSDKPQLNLVEGGDDASDRFSRDVSLANPGHGTLVASVSTSRGALDANGDTDDANSVTGTAPKAKILPIRAIRSVVDIRQSRIPAAIEHAIAQGADVIAMALGSPFVIEPVEVALRKAAEAGIVTVCAAGNCYGPVVFPAKMAPQGLAAAIAGVDYLYEPWEKSCRGPEVTVSAFGEAVYGARKSRLDDPGTVAPSQGTTLATSLTAGVAALWVARHGGRSKLVEKARAANTTVQRLFNDALQKTAYRPSGWASGMGAGLVNAGALLEFELKPALVPADVPIGVEHTTPLRRFLPAVVGQADALAGQEAARVDEDLAAELLWRFYRSSARARAAASGLPPPPPSDAAGPSAGDPTAELSAALQGAGRLKALA